MKVSLPRAITALTSALDFVGIDAIHHGKRVALMAQGIAQELGWDAATCRDMLYAGMLHDCGVSRVREHRQLTETLEWEGAEEHCRRGESFLLDCPPLARFAPVVRWHHARWETLCRDDLPRELALRANLIYLADRADVLLAPYFTGGLLRNDILWEYHSIASRLGDLAPALFAPELCAAFAHAAERESFWLRMDPFYIVEEISDCLEPDDSSELGTSDALAVAGLFARTVDAKSRYTLEHSTRVARIARYLAQQCGLHGETLDLVEIAGLLHDIGKLRVSEDILDKPGPISVQERAHVRRHSYDTGRILRRVFPGLPVADWASMHHEDLTGSGYPDHLPAGRIPLEARLIAVADIFHAFSQDRPYRQRLTVGDVLARLDDFCRLGRIDRGIVDLVRTHAEACYDLATAPGGDAGVGDPASSFLAAG